MTEPEPVPDAAPATDASAEEPLTGADLVEEVSIDGMCGVY